jgi:uncharacterized membrane protein
MRTKLFKQAIVLAVVGCGLSLVGCERKPEEKAPAAEEPGASFQLESPPPYDLTLPLQAIGNDPYWSIDVFERRVVFRKLATEGIEAPKAAMSDLQNGRSYKSGGGANAIALIVTKSICKDSSSGELFPVTVEANVGGQIYKGCGRPHPVVDIDKEWTTQLYELLPALGGCLARAPKASAVTVAVPADGKVRVRVAQGNSRFECIAAWSGKVERFGSYAEADALAGDRRYLFWAANSSARPSGKCVEATRVTDAGGKVVGYLTHQRC